MSNWLAPPGLHPPPRPAVLDPSAAAAAAAAAAAPPRLPWRPLLTAEEVQRALGYYGSGAALRRVAAKLLGGQPVTVVMLGGSITRGSGASRPAATFASRFFQFVNATWPHRRGSAGGCGCLWGKTEWLPAPAARLLAWL